MKIRHKTRIEMDTSDFDSLIRRGQLSGRGVEINLKTSPRQMKEIWDKYWADMLAFVGGPENMADLLAEEPQAAPPLFAMLNPHFTDREIIRD